VLSPTVRAVSRLELPNRSPCLLTTERTTDTMHVIKVGEMQQKGPRSTKSNVDVCMKRVSCVLGHGKVLLPAAESGACRTVYVQAMPTLCIENQKQHTRRCYQGRESRIRGAERTADGLVGGNAVRKVAGPWNDRLIKCHTFNTHFSLR
jgi:hypothetical protein